MLFYYNDFFLSILRKSTYQRLIWHRPRLMDAFLQPQVLFSTIRLQTFVSSRLSFIYEQQFSILATNVQLNLGQATKNAILLNYSEVLFRRIFQIVVMLKDMLPTMLQLNSKDINIFLKNEPILQKIHHPNNPSEQGWIMTFRGSQANEIMAPLRQSPIPVLNIFYS